MFTDDLDELEVAILLKRLEILTGARHHRPTSVFVRRRLLRVDEG